MLFADLATLVASTTVEIPPITSQEPKGADPAVWTFFGVLAGSLITALSAGLNNWSAERKEERQWNRQKEEKEINKKLDEAKDHQDKVEEYSKIIISNATSINQLFQLTERNRFPEDELKVIQNDILERHREVLKAYAGIIYLKPDILNDDEFLQEYHDHSYSPVRQSEIILDKLLSFVANSPRSPRLTDPVTVRKFAIAVDATAATERFIRGEKIPALLIIEVNLFSLKPSQREKLTKIYPGIIFNFFATLAPISLSIPSGTSPNEYIEWSLKEGNPDDFVSIFDEWEKDYDSAEMSGTQ